MTKRARSGVKTSPKPLPPPAHTGPQLVRPARPINFSALPDKREVRVRIGKDGKPIPGFPNRLIMPMDLQTELARTADQLWYPHPLPSHLRNPSSIINHCADADEYRSALIWLDEAFSPSVPIFNHPRAIARSRRDLSSQALAGITGLTVPQCVRFKAQSRASFERCFAEHGFQFPVLVRPIAGQTGQGLIKVERPDDWDAAVHTQWFGQPHFMTQFVEFATQEQVYLKARVLFIGGQFFIRHIKGANGWKVHNDSENSIRNFQDRELELVHSLNDNAHFARICAEVPGRTGLDFCGMDMGIDPDRNCFVMFECNAAMSVFFKTHEPVDSQRQARRDFFETPAALAFEAHLRTPQDWLWKNQSVSQGEDSQSCRTLLTA